MVTIDGIDSLNIVKDEVVATLAEAESHLESFTDNREQKESLQSCLELVRQVHGVLRLIAIPGITMVTTELEKLGASILENDESDIDAKLTAMTDFLMLVSHYLAYVHAKQRSLPVLLIPAVNRIRRLAGEPLESESCFFDVDLSSQRSFVNKYAPVEADQAATMCRRLRNMFQVGLIGVIRDASNPSADVNMMLRAVRRIDQLCGDVPLGRLWWVAAAVLEGMADGGITLSDSRKSLLGSVDRAIRDRVLNANGQNFEAPEDGLIKEFVYLAALAPSQRGALGEVRKAFDLESYPVSDVMIQAEQNLMNGPTGGVLESVTKALHEEFIQIKATLDLEYRGSDEPSTQSFSNVQDSLAKIASTLVILGLIEASNVIKDLVARLKSWDQNNQQPSYDDFQTIADALLYVENCIADFRKASEGGPTSETSGDDQMPGSQLEEARHIIVCESRAGLSLAKRAISSFIDSHWDGMHLNNVPTSLKTVWGGLKFLQLERAAQVLDRCNNFIQAKLLDVNEESHNPYLMETLADALTSIDYYLESMENRKPIGEGVLDLAEESVQELGFPVEVA